MLSLSGREGTGEAHCLVWVGRQHLSNLSVPSGAKHAGERQVSSWTGTCDRVALGDWAADRPCARKENELAFSASVLGPCFSVKPESWVISQWRVMALV